jgi:hypothetical protein
MKVRLGWLSHPWLHFALLAAVILAWRAGAFSWAVSFAQGGPLSSSHHEFRCRPGCIVCARDNPRARQGLDRLLIMTGAMDDPSEGPAHGGGPTR